MKYLILYAIACLFLCTACFEKEEVEETEVEVVPPEVDILKCELAQKFISYIENDSVRTPRSSIKQYNKGTIIIHEINDGGSLSRTPSIISYHLSNCEFICGNAAGIVQGQYCSVTFLDSLRYVKTVW